MNSSWWYAIGFGAAFLGFVQLENARRGLFLRPIDIFWSLVAGYLAVRHADNLSAGNSPEFLVWCALVFCAASPFLGYCWWGRDGRIRRRVFRLAAYFFLTALGFIIWMQVLGAAPLALALALITAALPFFPARRLLRRYIGRFRTWRRERREQRAASMELRQQRQESAEVQHYRRLHAASERKLRAKDRRIAALRKRDEQRQKRVERRRKEVCEQVRMLRESEIERLRQGREGLSLHPQYGFLMAEAWRMLRAQLARGERTPAVEHDAFFHQAVVELVTDDGFQQRYFHRKGRKAVAAVNRYLEGQESLATVQRNVKRLRLKPGQLAPYPLEGDMGVALVEAWLVPHRRQQERLREEFQDGQHPLQVQIAEFLRQHGEDAPDHSGWRALWDEHPAVFVRPLALSIQRPVQRRRKIRKWLRRWRLDLSTWRNAKAK